MEIQNKKHKIEKKEAIGIKCPSCGAGELSVDYTRPKPDSRLRVRKCDKCGRRFATIEKIGG